MTAFNTSSPIVVLGATGTVGRPLVRRLSELGRPVRAVSRVPDTAAFPATVEVVAGELGGDLAPVFDGVEVVLLHGPLVENLDELHAHAIDVAASAGVRRVVRISALGANPESSNPISRMHGRAEGALEASGMEWTHIQPHTFMDNFLAQADEIKAGDLYSASGDGRVPHVDAIDVAGVAVGALLDSGYVGQTLRVSGPVAYSYREIALTFSWLLGHRVVHRNLSPDGLIEHNVSAYGLPKWIAEGQAGLQRYWADGRSAKVYPTTRRVTGRPPSTLEQFIQRNGLAFSRSSEAAERLLHRISLDRIEAAERDSFPASDPPPWSGATATRGRMVGPRGLEPRTR